MSSKNTLPIKPLPPPLPLSKLIGPSFIILGLGLGSGEIVLWPYLTSQYGMGIIWGALVGLTLQYFMNLEIERYALARGESVFVGLWRKAKWLPWWFIASTFVPWFWPGIIASSATFLGTVFGVPAQFTSLLAIALLIVIGITLSFGPVLYKTVETLQKALIAIGVPTIFILSIVLAKPADWVQTVEGFVGIGNGYFFLPEGIAVASFLAALAYAGAGGNLNLAQSFYIKEKGYGMGKYAGRITSLLTGKAEKIELTGHDFEPNKEQVNVFYAWWKMMTIEHFIVFWLTGSITIILLGLLSYVTVHEFASTLKDNVGFVIFEANMIGQLLFPAAGTFFLIVAGLTLFGTQLTVLDATSRIIAENSVLASQGSIPAKRIPGIYYTVLWAQIASGITVFAFGFTQPLQLLTIAAVMNAFAMFIHVGLTLWLNTTELSKPLRPLLWRRAIMGFAFLFYGGFSLYVIANQIISFLK